MRLTWEDYSEPGDYELELTAINLVTSEVRLTETISVYRDINVTDVNVSSSLIIEPGSTVTFSAVIHQGSQVTLELQCSDGFQVRGLKV